MFTEFSKLVEKIKTRDKLTGEVISKLRDLYGLTVLEKSLPALYEVGYCPSHRKQFRDKTIQLSEELAEVSIGIIDAIAPPDRILSSSIGSSNGQVYSNIINQTENWPEVYSSPYWLPVLMKIKGLD